MFKTKLDLFYLKEYELELKDDENEEDKIMGIIKFLRMI